MEQYCSNLVVVLEQALEAYCYAETGQGKETAMNTIKNIVHTWYYWSLFIV